jgi:hypothetical protein
MLTMRTFLSIVLLAAVCGCGERATQSIAESHVEANVPSQDFDRYLRRDLESYFRLKNGNPVAVEYELLRDGPTQTGIAYPKFYVWVNVRVGDAVLERGTVRLAAESRNEFQVTDFVSEPEIRARPDAIYAVFPVPVCEKIKSNLGIER